MTVDEAVEFIRSTKGRFFTVEFAKRSDGSLRTMTCRTGVKAGLAGGEAAYDPVAHGLIWVYEINTHGRRSIPIEGLRRVKKNGLWHLVKQPQDSK